MVSLSVSYLLCHYTPTIEDYWNGSKVFFFDELSKNMVQSWQYDAYSQLNLIALTSWIVFSNDPASVLRACIEHVHVLMDRK